MTMNYEEANNIWHALNDVMTRNGEKRFNGYRPAMQRKDDGTYIVFIRECYTF